MEKWDLATARVWPGELGKGHAMGSLTRKRSREVLLLAAPVFALVLGCAAAPTVRAQSAAKTPPPAAPVEAKVTPAAPAAPIEPANYDLSSESPADAQSIIRARVNNLPILDEDVRAGSFRLLHSQELFQLSEEDRLRAVRQILSKTLQDIIDRELVISELDATIGKKKPQFLGELKKAATKECDKHIATLKKNLGMSDADLKKFFTSQGIPLEAYRRDFERNFMEMEYLRGMIFPYMKTSIGHHEILEYYQEHAAEFEGTDSLVWLDVFIDAGRFPSRDAARRVAEDVRSRAAKGDDFAGLVKQFDQGDSSWRKGEGVGNRPGEIRPPELEATLLKLKLNEVGPVLEVPTGFHVVKIAKREYTGRKPLNDDVQTEIRRKLMNELASREQRRILVELRRKASIEVINAERH
jgi:hypothetical protein